ncbi:hypothetical protein F2Q68_00015205 [Brassica cretica]|uniref:Uncharacterized protein n=1 Tax=Brassica cretica TaxID=69181 RepID=A0A8S9HRS8_BRACR|nr:hypothetical protein F2Q68_00015205 [Brassica cretica]
MQTNKLCLTLIDPTVYYDPMRVVKQQIGYMEIGDNPGFIVACHYNHEADEESEYAASFDNHTQQSIDSVIQLTIDNNPRESIDSSPLNEIFFLPEHCYPIFAINSQHPASKDYQYDVDILLPEMRFDEYDENYHKEKMIEYRGPGMDDEGVLHTSHTTNESTLIDSDVKQSIDINHIPDSIVKIENNTNYSYLTLDEFDIFRDPEGQAGAMDGRVLNICKEDVADIIAMNGPRSLFHTHNRAFDQPSTDTRPASFGDRLQSFD